MEMDEKGRPLGIRVFSLIFSLIDLQCAQMSLFSGLSHSVTQWVLSPWRGRGCVVS